MKKLLLTLFLILSFVFTTKGQIYLNRTENYIINELKTKYKDIEIIYVNQVRTIKVVTEATTNFYGIDENGNCFFVLITYDYIMKDIVIEILNNKYKRISKTKWISYEKDILIEMEEKKDSQLILVSAISL